MLHSLSFLNKIIEPGITVTKQEAIRRYRSFAEVKKTLLQLLCMTEFTTISRNEKGELYMV